MILINTLLAYLELLPNFYNENQAAFRLWCVIAHKTLFSPSFCCENTANKGAPFSQRKSGRVLHLVRYSAPVGFCAFVYCVHQHVDVCHIHGETNVTS